MHSSIQRWLDLKLNYLIGNFMTFNLHTVINTEKENRMTIRVKKTETKDQWIWKLETWIIRSLQGKELETWIIKSLQGKELELEENFVKVGLDILTVSKTVFSYYF